MTEGNHLEAKNIINDGSTLSLRINCEYLHQMHTNFKRKMSPPFKLNESLTFRIKAESINHNDIVSTIFIRFMKNRDVDTKYEIKFSSPELRIENKCFNHDGTWCELVSHFKENIIINPFFTSKPNFFNVEVRWSKVRTVADCFATLYDDEDLVDFQLKAEDGSVQMHKAVLAASSPVLRRMLGGACRETAEGCVEVPDVSKDTLQHLKDYIYLNKLPETGLQELLLLASIYMMTDLENRVKDKIVDNMKAESALDMLNFAFTHKQHTLQVAILKEIQAGRIKVHKMQQTGSGVITAIEDNESDSE